MRQVDKVAAGTPRARTRQNPAAHIPHPTATADTAASRFSCSAPALEVGFYALFLNTLVFSGKSTTQKHRDGKSVRHHPQQTYRCILHHICLTCSETVTDTACSSHLGSWASPCTWQRGRVWSATHMQQQGRLPPKLICKLLKHKQVKIHSMELVLRRETSNFCSGMKT